MKTSALILCALAAAASCKRQGAAIVKDEESAAPAATCEARQSEAGAAADKLLAEADAAMAASKYKDGMPAPEQSPSPGDPAATTPDDGAWKAELDDSDPLGKALDLRRAAQLLKEMTAAPCEQFAANVAAAAGPGEQASTEGFALADDPVISPEFKRLGFMVGPKSKDNVSNLFLKEPTFKNVDESPAGTARRIYRWLNAETGLMVMTDLTFKGVTKAEMEKKPGRVYEDVPGRNESRLKYTTIWPTDAFYQPEYDGIYSVKVSFKDVSTSADSFRYVTLRFGRFYQEFFFSFKAGSTPPDLRLSYLNRFTKGTPLQYFAADTTPLCASMRTVNESCRLKSEWQPAAGAGPYCLVNPTNSISTFKQLSSFRCAAAVNMYYDKATKRLASWWYNSGDAKWQPRCIDIDPGAKIDTSGYKAYLNNCHGGENQQFDYVDGTLTVKFKPIDKPYPETFCLDVNYGGGPDRFGRLYPGNYQVYAYPCHSQANQKWSFEAIP